MRESPEDSLMRSYRSGGQQKELCATIELNSCDEQPAFKRVNFFYKLYHIYLQTDKLFLYLPFKARYPRSCLKAIRNLFEKPTEMSNGK